MENMLGTKHFTRINSSQYPPPIYPVRLVYYYPHFVDAQEHISNRARTQPRQPGAKSCCLTMVNNQTSYHSHILLLDFVVFLTYSKVDLTI